MNPMEFLESNLQQLESGQSKFVVKYYESKQLPQSLLDWSFNLLKENMKSLYENCEWGWNTDSKMKELTSKKAKFLIVFNLGKETKKEIPVAFVHFRYDMDYGRRVVYCYEIQLEVGARGHKIGTWLMKLLEIIGSKDNRSIVVLTVLKENQQAIGFYKNIGYGLDETSPDKSEARPYFIFSKTVSLTIQPNVE